MGNIFNKDFRDFIAALNKMKYDIFLLEVIPLYYMVILGLQETWTYGLIELKIII